MKNQREIAAGWATLVRACVSALANMNECVCVHARTKVVHVCERVCVCVSVSAKRERACLLHLLLSSHS